LDTGETTLILLFHLFFKSFVMLAAKPSSTSIIFSSDLNALGNVRYAFFDRSWGREGFLPLRSEPDFAPWRKRIASFFEVSPQNVLCCRQIHSTTVVPINEPWPFSNAPDADGIVTNKRGLVLAVLTADCVPVLLADSKTGVIGAAHAGWRGALGGVLENALRVMEESGAYRENIVAALGPCIAQASYEVDEAFSLPFLRKRPENAHFFKPFIKNGKYLFDLPAYVAEQLRLLGVGKISVCSEDTYTNPERFFSHRYSTHRNETQKGNLISAIILQ